eukprot:XP_020393661.1 serine/arginine repetitive matrix protein 1-like [Zea mays]
MPTPLVESLAFTARSSTSTPPTPAVQAPVPRGDDPDDSGDDDDEMTTTTKTKRNKSMRSPTTPSRTTSWAAARLLAASPSRRRAAPARRLPGSPRATPARRARSPPRATPARRLPVSPPHARLLAAAHHRRLLATAACSPPRARLLAAARRRAPPPPARPAPARCTVVCSFAGVPVCSAASPSPGAQPPHIPLSPFRPARYLPSPAPPVTVVASDGYAAGFRRAVNLKTNKITGLKSHDYHIMMERLLPVMFRGYSIFDNVIDSSQVTVQRGGSSRSAARSSRRSTQDTAEVEQLREELRQHQERQRIQEEYLRQHAAQQEYYATQFQQQQALIQQLAQAQGIQFPMAPPPPPSIHFPWPSPPPPPTEHQVYETPPATLPAQQQDDGLDFVNTLFASGGSEHHSSIFPDVDRQ